MFDFLTNSIWKKLYKLEILTHIEIWYKSIFLIIFMFILQDNKFCFISSLYSCSYTCFCPKNNIHLLSCGAADMILSWHASLLANVFFILLFGYAFPSMLSFKCFLFFTLLLLYHLLVHWWNIFHHQACFLMFGVVMVYFSPIISFSLYKCCFEIRVKFFAR